MQKHRLCYEFFLNTKLNMSNNQNHIKMSGIDKT